MEEKLSAAVESQLRDMEESLSCAVDAKVRNIVAETAYARRVAQYQNLRTEVAKGVSIEIAEDDLHTLKKARYKLCIAKKVKDGDFNVVWKSMEEYSTYTEISWTPTYALFATKKFEGNVRISMATRAASIGLGQTCLLDSACYMNDATSGGPNTALTLNNQYAKPIHVGVSQVVGDDEEQKSRPIYVAPLEAIMGKVTLTPVEVVQVWFSQHLETSTMFSDAVSNAIVVDLTFSNQKSLKFENSVWKIV